MLVDIKHVLDDAHKRSATKIKFLLLVPMDEAHILSL